MRWLLLPFSLLYGFIVILRNKCFDWGIFKQSTFPIPVISVGNITVGGTGKTPHSEFLIHWLEEKFSLALLSRGYKRKTTGFLEVQEHTHVSQVGDEPLQIKQKFPDILVAVDEKR
ncbi:MAG TPA: tetraacyldisaccharide 4'-kinase, partial [Marinilabiliales bacterium]|nr:tetraacyldisaccharide 4'-kinase [Marinilabiliales bacterium]